MKEKTISHSCDTNILVMLILYLIICYLLSLFMELYIMLGVDVLIAFTFIYGSQYVFTKRILMLGHNKTLIVSTENLREKYYHEETFNIDEVAEIYSIKANEYSKTEELDFNYFQNVNNKKYLVCIRLLDDRTIIVKYTNEKFANRLAEKLNREIKEAI